jgi:Uma2 family endonuclease
MAAMASATSRPRKTVSDFMALPQGTRAELIGGEIHVTPSPFRPHQEVVLALGSLLRAWALAQRAGRVYVAPLDVHLPTGDIVEPDVLFVSEARSAILQDWIRGVPDLLVEVLSTPDVQRDRVLKRELYARNGVPEYWIVDPEGRSIEVLRLQRGAYDLVRRFRAPETLATQALPGLELPLGDVFA